MGGRSIRAGHPSYWLDRSFTEKAWAGQWNEVVLGSG
jgi:hypothetical protein